MFDYSQLDPEVSEFCQLEARRIKSLASKTAELAIQIGQELFDVKEVLGHGHFGPWLQAEFGWSERTAQNYMRLYHTFKNANFADLNIGLSALHLLASPAVDDDTRAAALDLARENGSLSYTDARDLLSSPQWGEAGANGTRVIFTGPPDNDGDSILFTANAPVAQRHHREPPPVEGEFIEMESAVVVYDAPPPSGGRPGGGQDQPKALTKIIRIDPVMAPPPVVADAIDYLNQVYKQQTGRFYFERTQQ